MTLLILKRLLYFALIFWGAFSYGQACPTLNGPEDGDVNVPVETEITWTAVDNVPGYLLAIGTTPGDDDIVAQQNVGIATSFTPPIGLPAGTEVHVTITLFFFDRENIVCASESFTTENVTVPPDCTSPGFPLDGATDVNVGTQISWPYATKATGYRLSIGTTPGAVDILDRENIPAALSYRPDPVLPADEEIFVRVVPYNENGETTGCTEISFTTSATQSLPDCTQLANPPNGALNVSLTPFLEWPEVPNAEGYRITLGTTPFNNDVLDNAIFTNNSTFVIDFEPNRTFFARIVPFNDAGDAIGCAQTTFSTILGCGPFVNSETGETFTLAPDISFPELVSTCQNDFPLTLSSEDEADGYRWYKINTDESEELLSETGSVSLTEAGNYRYEAYNTASQSDNSIECPSTQEFMVVTSEIATITEVSVSGQNGALNLDVIAEGIGSYEYALDDENGPYQDSPAFGNLPIGPYTVYVRDKNGCGTVSETVQPDLTLEGFPKFFTPNGDGINDLWQFIPPPEGDYAVGPIFIFDRFGTLLAQIDSNTPGWDGTFNGRRMPASDYWFKTTADGREIQGHFTLKR